MKENIDEMSSSRENNVIEVEMNREDGHSEKFHTKAEVFASLGHMLTYARDSKDVARIILHAADELFGWETASFDLYDHSKKLTSTVLHFTTTNKEHTELKESTVWEQPAAAVAKAIAEGAQLIGENESIDASVHKPGQGSVMVVPVKNGMIRGVITICSNRSKVFTINDLVTFQDLAEHCAGAIERIQTEELLRSSEEKMRALIENNTDLITLIDTNGAIVFESPSVTEILGYAMGELIGANAFQLLHPEDLQPAMALFTDLVEGKSRAARLELRFRTKSGGWCWLDCRGLNKLNNPSIKAIIVNARDITDRKRMENDLQRSALQYKMMFDNNPMPMWAYDLETQRILGVNKSAVKHYGYSEEEFLSMTANAINAVESGVQSRRRPYSDSDGVFRTAKHMTKSGKEIDVEITAHEIEYNGKRAELVMVLDVTEKISLEQQIFKTQKMESVGRLSGEIAHDFNNILGIVLAHTSRIERHAQMDVKFSENIGAIQTAVKRGAEIVKQLLTFARKNDVTIENIDVNGHILEMQKMIRETFPRDIEIVLDLTTAEPEIVADSTQLQQVFLNLAVNARDAMPNGGELKIRTSVNSGEQVRKKFPDATDSHYVCIEVSDSGCGMSQEVRSRIFEPFFTTKESGKGTGLGLAVAYGVVTKQNGFIDVHSEIGKGTTFSLVFPSSKNIAAAPKSVLDDELVSGGGSETILLVEDEQLLAQLVHYMLQENGYQVLTAHDGVEALDIYAKNIDRIDLVISDIGLPKMSGTQLITRLKELNKNIKVILASGYIETELKELLLKEGAVDFIHKPYRSAELFKSVRQALNH